MTAGNTSEEQQFTSGELPAGTDETLVTMYKVAENVLATGYETNGWPMVTMDVIRSGGTLAELESALRQLPPYSRH